MKKIIKCTLTVLCLINFLVTFQVGFRIGCGMWMIMGEGGGV